MLIGIVQPEEDEIEETKIYKKKNRTLELNEI